MYMHIHTHIRTNNHLYVHEHIHTYIHAYVHLFVQKHTQSVADMCRHKSSYALSLIYTSAHTYTTPTHKAHQTPTIAFANTRSQS